MSEGPPLAAHRGGSEQTLGKLQTDPPFAEATAWQGGRKADGQRAEDQRAED
jgi:hypothetical protein